VNKGRELSLLCV